MFNITRSPGRHVSPWLTRFFVAILKPVSCLVLFAGIFSQSATTQAQTIIWREEFTNGFDSATWTPDIGDGCQYGPNLCGWGNQELQWYTDRPENLQVTNGLLYIVAREESPAYNGKAFTSARIKTEDKLFFKYGTVEARIKVPDLGNGLWPAFWTLGNNRSSVGWPACGEIDVMEMGSGSAISGGVVNRQVGATAHWENNNQHSSSGATYVAPSDLDGAFHLYRLGWTPSALSAYVDNVRIWTFDISDPAGFDGEEFHAPHFLLLNLAVGGNYTGITNPNQITAPFPAEYVIDYIRLYANPYTELGGSSLEQPLPVSLSAALVGGSIQISFPTQNGVNYDVVYKNSMADSTWQFIETVAGDGTTKSVSYPATNPARAYAVQIP